MVVSVALPLSVAAQFRADLTALAVSGFAGSGTVLLGIEHKVDFARRVSIRLLALFQMPQQQGQSEFSVALRVLIEGQGQDALLQQL
ncbi:hypothetical protein CRX72_07055, partial [Pantoea sp. BRM17]